MLATGWQFKSSRTGFIFGSALYSFIEGLSHFLIGVKIFIFSDYFLQRVGCVKVHNLYTAALLENLQLTFGDFRDLEKQYSRPNVILPFKFIFPNTTSRG